MGRVLSYVIRVAILTGVVIWLAEHPGALTIDWLGWRIDTSVALALGLLAILGWLGLAAFDRLGQLLRWPGGWRERRRAGRSARETELLGRGLIAVAAGDVAEGRRIARQARHATAAPALKLMLEAQIAQGEGDSAGFDSAVKAMLASPETELLGLRGLIAAARRGGDPAVARRHAERAVALAPDVGWAALALVELTLAAGDWTAAEAAIDRAARVLKRDRAAGADARLDHKRAVAALGRSAEHAARGQMDRALEAAREAGKADPGFVPAIAAEARLLIARGQAAKAASVIERAWAAGAHPELATIYAAIVASDEPTARLKRVERLAQLAPRAVESELLLADAAAEARLWGMARHHYERAAEHPEARALAHAGLARVAESDADGGLDAESQRRQARDFFPGAWSCEACGHRAEIWSPRCPSCATVDTLAWRPGGPARPAALAPPKVA